MKNLGIILLLFAVCSLGCKTKKEVVSKNSIPTDGVVNKEVQKIERCGDYENDVIWYELSGGGMVEQGQSFAKKSKVFSVTDAQLQHYIEINFKRQNAFNLIVPVYEGGKVVCHTFQLTNSETISREKQMGLSHFTFRAFELENELNTARFDFLPERGLRGYIKLGSETYLFEPMGRGTEKYYVSYNKNDATRAKEDFEDNRN